MPSIRQLAHRERTEFADLLAGFSPQDWGKPTLCDGWTVRDVAAHTIAYLGQSLPQLVRNMIAERGDIDRLNARGMADYADVVPGQLVDLMRRGAEPSGAGALYGGRVALIECLVHQQDIRRPLGRPRALNQDALRISLNYARINPVVGGARRSRGVRLVATDSDWAAGKGPEVYGTGEALLLAMTGRGADVADELDGDGAAQLLG